jgi:hypothetical protein
MALQKTKTAANGVTGDYWQIANRNYIKDTNKTAVLVRCYKDAAVRASGLANHLGYEFQMVREFDGDLTMAQCYTKLKDPIVSDGLEVDNLFADAVDC